MSSADIKAYLDYPVKVCQKNVIIRSNVLSKKKKKVFWKCTNGMGSYQHFCSSFIRNTSSDNCPHYIYWTATYLWGLVFFQLAQIIFDFIGLNLVLRRTINDQGRNIVFTVIFFSLELCGIWKKFEYFCYSWNISQQQFSYSIRWF